jgi:uncharacterized protein with HEPN domain
VRSPAERLRDIREAIDAIERYTAQGRERYDGDELVRSWVLRHLQIIGEAARALPDALRQRAPEIPWHLVIGARNVLVHGYFHIDPDEVWTTAERDLPPLRQAVGRLLAELGEPDAPSAG